MWALPCQFPPATLPLLQCPRPGLEELLGHAVPDPSHAADEDAGLSGCQALLSLGPRWFPQSRWAESRRRDPGQGPEETLESSLIHLPSRGPQRALVETLSPLLSPESTEQTQPGRRWSLGGVKTTAGWGRTPVASPPLPGVKGGSWVWRFRRRPPSVL